VLSGGLPLTVYVGRTGGDTLGKTLPMYPGGPAIRLNCFYSKTTPSGPGRISCFGHTIFNREAPSLRRLTYLYPTV
jgi:hypothetical protein